MTIRCVMCGGPTTADAARARIGTTVGPVCDDCAYWHDGNVVLPPSTHEMNPPTASDELPELSEGDAWFIIGWLEDAHPAVYQRAIASLRGHRARVEQQHQHRQERVATTSVVPALPTERN